MIFRKTEAPILRRTFLASLTTPLCVAAPSVTLGRDGMLVIEGQRRFVLGLYDLPKLPDGWEQARSAGFNLVHTRPSAEDIGLARRHGMHTWVSVGSISAVKRSADQARIRAIVEKFRNDPALLFWETEDEPSFVWKKREARISPEQIIETHDFVKSLDPAHPLYLNHAPVNLESTLQRYNAGAEIIATDIYPVIPHGIREQYALWPDGQQGDLSDTTIGQVGRYTDKMRRVAGPSRAVFMVLQAFAWEDLRKENKDPKMVLYPDRGQIRFMAYQSIIHGANGILFWGLPFVPSGAPLWADLRSVAREIRDLLPALAQPAAQLTLGIEYRDTGHSLDRGIEWSARPIEGGLLLLCVNADRNPVEATITIPATFRRCQIAAGGADVPVSRGAIAQAFAPFEARALRLS